MADLETKDPSSDATLGNVRTYSDPYTFEKYAGFIGLNVHVTDGVVFQRDAREIYIDLGVLNMVILGSWPLPSGLK